MIRKLSFGEVLEYLMKQAEVNDSLLAAELGVLPATVENWRKNLIHPPAEEIVQVMADSLDVDPGMLLVAIPKEDSQ